MSYGKDILEDAVKDCEKIKEVAFENAKNMLVEAMAPNIKRLVESEIGATDVQFEMPTYEVKDEEEEGEMDLESTGMYEVADEESDEEVEESVAPAVTTEGEDEGCDDDEETVDEYVEVTEADLAQAFQEVFGRSLAEAEVTKGFGDVQDATLKVSGGKQETGLADKKDSESPWNEETPPDAEDWTVKEQAYRNKIHELVSRLKEYKRAYQMVRRNLSEVNLFNSKLLYSTKLIQHPNMSERMRTHIVESIDSAGSIREVQMLYKTLSENLKIAGVLSESKRAGNKTARSSKFTTKSATVLNEQVDTQENQEANRWVQLAGIIK